MQVRLVGAVSLGLSTTASRSVGMIVSVMQIRIVGVPMRDRRVPVAMRMGFARRITRGVFVLMMEVVDVAMGMLQRFMRVLMIVGLRGV